MISPTSLLDIFIGIQLRGSTRIIYLKAKKMEQLRKHNIYLYFVGIQFQGWQIFSYFRPSGIPHEIL